MGTAFFLKDSVPSELNNKNVGTVLVPNWSLIKIPRSL